MHGPRLILTAALLLGGATRLAFAAEPSAQVNPPSRWSVDAKIVDQAGKVYPFWTETQSAWIWGKASPEDPYERPLLRTWVAFPKDVGFISWTKINPTSSIVRIVVNPRDAPLQAKGKQAILAIDSDLPLSTAGLKLAVGGRVRQFSLLVKVGVTQPLNLIHPSCDTTGVFIMQRKASASYLFNAAYCRTEGDLIELYLCLLYTSDAADE